MKILHVVNVSFVIPYFLGEQINYFGKNGHEIYIVCSKSSDLPYFSNKYNFKYQTIEISRDFNILNDLCSLIKLFKFIQKKNFDVVVGHTPKAAMLAMIASFFNHIHKRIYFRHGLMFETSHGLKYNIFILIEKLTSKFASLTICVSKSVLDTSLKLNLSHKNKTLVINNGTCNGIDYLNKFNPDLFNANDLLKLKEQFNIKESDFVIGYVGRIVKDKGIIEILKAWDILKTKYKNLKLLLIGPYEKRDSIDKIYKDKIYNDNDIINLGFIEDTSVYYNLMNIFLLPSYREGFPTVVLEASSMEIPIITSKKTGCIDSIIENKTGIFCDINPNSIVSCVEKYYLNNFLCEYHGKNGRNFVIENFNQKKIWDKLQTIYNETIV